MHDLIRLGRPVKGLAPDADVLRWPIPQRDLDANNNLVQNPGY
ncbi:MAG: RagB/SusD family nutrient uptake outer membrane protein [Saprospiraceae bacterium]|nr:RagB/SusD family nutrient uptake outer membrane protein [Saprospiraceae bacterium]